MSSIQLQAGGTGAADFIATFFIGQANCAMSNLSFEAGWLRKGEGKLGRGDRLLDGTRQRIQTLLNLLSLPSSLRPAVPRPSRTMGLDA